MGLCGFYDGNQKNDLKTRQNIVESNSCVFANQWATDDSKCTDVNAYTEKDPCYSEPQRLAMAKSLCSHLKNQTFEGE